MKLINNCTYSSHLDSIFETISTPLQKHSVPFETDGFIFYSGSYDSVNRAPRQGVSPELEILFPLVLYKPVNLGRFSQVGDDYTAYQDLGEQATEVNLFWLINIETDLLCIGGRKKLERGSDSLPTMQLVSIRSLGVGSNCMLYKLKVHVHKLTYPESRDKQ